MLIKKLTVFILTMLVSVPLAGYAQDTKEDIPQAVWTAAQIDPTDNSVFYSLYLTTGEDALTDVTVSADLPEGATFVKDFWTPEAAAFAGEKDGIVTWTLNEAEAGLVVGPFTFVTSFEDSASEDFAPPADFKAHVTAADLALENEVADTTLTPLAESGAIDLTPEGLLDFTAVEDTGIWVYAPTDTVSDTVTLSFERKPIDKDAALPEAADETWWCGFVSLSANTDVSLAEPIVLIVPLLRASTPGLIMPVFAQSEGGEWTLLSAEDSVTSLYSEGAETAAAFAKIAPTGTEAYILLNAAQLTSTPINLAVGVNAKLRVVSTASIKDGTSNITNGDPAPWF